MDVPLAVAGALTGFVVGLTGVGGGALMTPTGVGSALTAAVGLAVCVSAGGLLAQQRLRAFATELDQRLGGGIRSWQVPVTVLSGVMLGVLVTVTSVGAGALGAICLLYLYPSRLTPPRLIATDVAHAIPLALFAGLGHLAIGNVDGALLVNLLVGSLPAAMAGVALSARLPHAWLRVALAMVLLVIGIKLLYS